jgi:hypothetical protein
MTSGTAVSSSFDCLLSRFLTLTLTLEHFCVGGVHFLFISCGEWATIAVWMRRSTNTITILAIQVKHYESGVLPNKRNKLEVSKELNASFDSLINSDCLVNILMCCVAVRQCMTAWTVSRCVANAAVKREQMIHSIKLKQELLCYICTENATLESIQNAFV